MKKNVYESMQDWSLRVQGDLKEILARNESARLKHAAFPYIGRVPALLHCVSFPSTRPRRSQQKPVCK